MVDDAIIDLTPQWIDLPCLPLRCLFEIVNIMSQNILLLYFLSMLPKFWQYETFSLYLSKPLSTNNATTLHLNFL